MRPWQALLCAFVAAFIGAFVCVATLHLLDHHRTIHEKCVYIAKTNDTLCTFKGRP